MKSKNFEEKKYKLELEVVELKDQYQPERMVKLARKNLKKVILNKIDGNVGEC